MNLKSCLLYGVLWVPAVTCVAEKVDEKTIEGLDHGCQREMATGSIEGDCFFNFLATTNKAFFDQLTLNVYRERVNEWGMGERLPKGASVQEVELAVLLSLFLGDEKLLTELLTTHEEAREYLRKRFYGQHAMLTHLAAASPFSSPELLGALFANKWFCSKAKLTDGRMAWEVARDLGRDLVAAFAKGRAESCKGTPAATPLPEAPEEPAWACHEEL